MIDVDGKPFSTAVTGVVTLATCYIAGWTDWALLVLQLSVMVTFWLAFRSPALPAEVLVPIKGTFQRAHASFAPRVEPPLPNSNAP